MTRRLMYSIDMRVDCPMTVRGPCIFINGHMNGQVSRVLEFEWTGVPSIL